MKPTQFPESNQKLLPPKGMADCEPLAVFNDGRHCISRWQPTWLDRLRIAFGRPIWLWVCMCPQPPVSIETDYPFRREKGGGK